MFTNTSKGKILLVEPSQDLAKNLKVLLATMEDFRIVGQCSSGLEAMRMMSIMSPDVLILDISLPDMIAMDIAFWVGRLFPKARVVLLSSHNLPEYRAVVARMKNSILVNKADLWRKMPRALTSFRQEQLAREGERGGIFIPHLNRELRHLAAWIERSSRTRNRAHVWRFIHLGMGLLSIELVVPLFWHGVQSPTLMLAEWTVILVAIARDLQTLRSRAGLAVMNMIGDGNHV